MASPLANPHQHYLKTQIETASQPQLLLMIFDAAVKKLHMSKRAIEKKEIEKAHTELTKVQSIFTELMVALDFEKGGEVAENLLRVYDFVYHQLVKANIKQDIALIDEVLPIVEDLRNGWTKAVDKYMREEGGAEAQQTAMPTQKTAMQRPGGNVSSYLPKPNMPPKAPMPMPKPPVFNQVPPAAAAVNSGQPGEDQPPRPRLNIRG